MAGLEYYLGILTTIIVNKYFNESCTLILTDKFGPDIQISVPFTIFEHVDETALALGCQNIVIHNGEPDKMVVLLEDKIRNSSPRFNDRKYLISLRKDFQDFKNLYLLFHFVPNVVLVKYEIFKIKNCTFLEICNNFVFTFWTNNFVGVENNDDFYILDFWFSKNQTFLFNKKLYFDKIKNMEGRVLKMATFSYEPYAIVGKYSSFYSFHPLAAFFPVVGFSASCLAEWTFFDTVGSQLGYNVKNPLLYLSDHLLGG